MDPQHGYAKYRNRAQYSFESDVLKRLKEEDEEFLIGVDGDTGRLLSGPTYHHEIRLPTPNGAE